MPARPETRPLPALAAGTFVEIGHEAQRQPDHRVRTSEVPATSAGNGSIVPGLEPGPEDNAKEDLFPALVAGTFLGIEKEVQTHTNYRVKTRKVPAARAGNGLPPHHTAALIDPRYARLLGRDAWRGLPATVRARFAKRLGSGDAAVYRGQVVHTRMNLAGRLLAQACRVAGAPLPLDCGNAGAAAVVSVTEDAHGDGQFWLRQYSRKGRGFPQVIHSTKRFTGATGCEEWVSAWLGMSLAVRAVPDGIVFESDRYLFRIGPIRLALPRWLTPGQLTVGHHDRGDGTFDFTLALRHRLLGTLLDQRIRFHDMKDTT